MWNRLRLNRLRLNWWRAGGRGARWPLLRLRRLSGYVWDIIRNVGHHRVEPSESFAVVLVI